MAHWIDNADSWICSWCGFETGRISPVCPKCGATMENVAEINKHVEDSIGKKNIICRYPSDLTIIKVEHGSVELAESIHEFLENRHNEKWIMTDQSQEWIREPIDPRKPYELKYRKIRSYTWKEVSCPQ